MPDIRDITDPGLFIPEPSTPLKVWLTLALGIILLATVIYWSYKLREDDTPLKTPSIDDARDEINVLRAEAANMEPHEAATELSLIIRRYLAGAFSDPALFETNEEFTLRQQALAKLHPESRQLVTQHLSELSQMKYSPAKGKRLSEIITGHIDQADEVLSHIDLHLNQQASSPQAVS